MGAIVNGMLYHGSFRPYAATFLVFSDYMRPSIRLAALAGLPAIYVFTHDSFWVGEDGPTHQPVEHVEALRLIPNLDVWRPADGRETAAAWGAALERTDGPTALILTRQGVPAVVPDGIATDTFARGGYRIAGDGSPDAVVLATGSEVHLALGARTALAERGRDVHVVSVPCVERFHAQDASYRDAIVPPGARVATLEAGRTTAWRAAAGRDGLTLGMDRFGASAPGGVLADRFGFTVEAVAERIGAWLDGDA
jgi:transketolase